MRVGQSVMLISVMVEVMVEANADPEVVITGGLDGAAGVVPSPDTVTVTRFEDVTVDPGSVIVTISVSIVVEPVRTDVETIVLP